MPQCKLRGKDSAPAGGGHSFSMLPVRGGEIGQVLRFSIRKSSLVTYLGYILQFNVSRQ